MKIAVFASGRGSNLKALLDAKASGNLDNVEFGLVFSDNPDARALRIAGEHNITYEVIDPKPYRKKREEYDARILSILEKYDIEFIVLAGYMRIVSTVILDAYPNKIINIHPALLPSFPGLHGQRQTVEYGAKVSGCTVHFVDAGVDTGPIILQAVVPVLDDDDEDSLSSRILEYEHQLYPRALELVSSGKVRIDGRRVFVDDDEWRRGIRPGTLGPVR